MTPPVFVEICAATASTGLCWLSPETQSVLGYTGAKKPYRFALLDLLGMKPGEGARDGILVLIDGGPWGEAWTLWKSEEGRRHTAERLAAWAKEGDLRGLFERLSKAPVPDRLEDRVVAWAALQHLSFGGKSLGVENGRWKTAGVNAAMVEGRAWDIGLDGVAARIMVLPGPALARAIVIHGDARKVAPIPGARVLFDPPYKDTTDYVGQEFPREDVLAVATAWREAGCRVGVCEQEPLPLPGWRHVDLPAPLGLRRTFSKQKREVVTLSHWDPVQGRLFGDESAPISLPVVDEEDETAAQDSQGDPS